MLGASQGDDQRHPQLHSVGHGLATKCNRKPQNANERIARDIRKWILTNCLRVVKCKMEVSKSYDASESGHARTTVRVVQTKMKVIES